MGAEVLAVPCNTAHYFIDDFKAALPQPLVHIIEETVLAAQRLNPEALGCCRRMVRAPAVCIRNMPINTVITLYLPNEEQAEKAQQAIFMSKPASLAGQAL